MESKRLILSIYNVSEYLYCQKSCFYKIFHFEENQDENVAIIEGRNQHDTVHSTSIRHREKGVRQLTNLSIFSHKLNIRGKTDLFEIKGDECYLVEYKKGKFKNFLNHKIQLCLQTLCIEEMYNVNISSGYLYFIEENKRYKISIDSELRNISISTIKEIREKLITYNPRLFVKNQNQLCEKCSFFQTCLPFLTNT
ncbi:MAG: CRISPR-associated protein Cas4 [Rickettsiales bacterium]|jgi:CRISPR-associated exonuclease Cas4|nr:CRISPR-associated protein Cas4 [Rickettsiales bacterium]